MMQQILRNSVLDGSTKIESNMCSLAPPPSIRNIYPKGSSQLRIRHTEGGGVCAVRAVAVVIQGRVQLRMVFDPSFYK
jgi:hypothetical protein